MAKTITYKEAARRYREKKFIENIKYSAIFKSSRPPSPKMTILEREEIKNKIVNDYLKTQMRNLKM